jgi:hypothetical protein
MYRQAVSCPSEAIFSPQSAWPTSQDDAAPKQDNALEIRLYHRSVHPTAYSDCLPYTHYFRLIKFPGANLTNLRDFVVFIAPNVSAGDKSSLFSGCVREARQVTNRGVCRVLRGVGKSAGEDLRIIPDLSHGRVRNRTLDGPLSVEFDRSVCAT